MNHKIKWWIFHFTMLVLLFVSCGNKQQSTNTAIDSLIVGKWKMVEYAYHFITSDSLAIYNRSFGEQHYKILELSNDSLIRQIRRQRVYSDSIDEPVNGEIEKYIRVTDSTFFERNPIYREN